MSVTQDYKFITPAQSREARGWLDMSQAEVIKNSGLPGHKLKQFEAGRYMPEDEFLHKLLEFYARMGFQRTEKADSRRTEEPAKNDETSGRELLDACNQTVENFQEFITRTSRRDLLAKIAELVNEHINTVLIVNELGQHFADTNPNGVKAGKNIVAFDSFHNFLRKTPSVAKPAALLPPVQMTERAWRVRELLAKLAHIEEAYK